MKKIGFVLALVLTLAMLTAMTGPAFAETSGAGFAEGLAPDADTAQVLQMEMEHREEIT